MGAKINAVPIPAGREGELAGRGGIGESSAEEIALSSGGAK